MEPDNSVPVAGNPAPWANVDQRGISIEDDAALAAAQGGTMRHRVVTGLSSSSLDEDIAAGGIGVRDSIEFTVSANGTVTMLTEDWEPVIEDGWLTEFRRTGDD